MGVLIIQFKGRVFDRPLTRTLIIQFEIKHEPGPYDLGSAQYHSSHALDNGGKPALGFVRAMTILPNLTVYRTC